MRLPILRLRPRGELLDKDTLVAKAAEAARRPAALDELPPAERRQVEPIVKAIQVGAGSARPPRIGSLQRAKPVSAAVVAARAHQVLAPSSSITPSDIALALQAQGLDWVEPFSPGEPLVPYYGYGRRPRQYDYDIGRNVTTETRPDRIPFITLKQLYDNYDVAQICTRHAINGLRSMRLRFEAMEGYEDNPVKEIAEARRRLRRPDGKRFFKNWLAQNMLDLWRYDSAPIYRMRDRAGRVKYLKNISAPTLAVMVDYYGDFPSSPAPAFQQFIEGVPWDWLTWDDIIYEPFWPQTESPYGTPPLETVLINANTDIRLQLYFLQFFTAGQVPEAFAIAPEDMTTSDDLADFQEFYDAQTTGDQSDRWGLKWLPHGTELNFYKPQTFDPDLAEYVMRRTVAAFLQTPHNLGFTDDVNRASGDTQMDVQFRIDDLPTTSYYEDILDSVIQEDWDLPVQVRFDTGGDKEDRVQEAQAHQIYVQMGAESLDEVREKVLGYPINPEERIPRMVFDQRLGVIPLAHVIAISGQVDPLTGAPVAGSVAPQPYQLPGGGTPPPAAGPTGQGGPPHAPAGAGPKVPDPTKAYPRAPRRAGKSAREPGNEPVDSREDEESEAAESPEGAPGYGLVHMGSTAQGTGVKAQEDLRRWQRHARKALSAGKRPRRFAEVALSDQVTEAIWRELQVARTRADVDAIFTKALKWADFHRRTDFLLDHYTPIVAAAMRRVFSTQDLTAVIVRGYRHAKATAPSGRGTNLPPNQAAVVAGASAGAGAGVAGGGLAGVAGGGAAAGAAAAGAAGVGAALAALAALPKTTEGLWGVLTDIYGDAFMEGAHEAAMAAGGEMPPWTRAVEVPADYWTRWQSGTGRAAAAVAGSGLGELLAERERWIREITDTEMDRIGAAIAGGIESGFPVKEVVAQVNAVVNDESRARLIAETEYARAMTVGMRETYRANHVPMVQWIEQPGACALCQENHAVSPLPLSATWPNGNVPVHPHCRCVEAPYVQIPGVQP